MIVTGILPWWDEPPELLEACVRGLADIADRVVAVDGAYRRYPGATISSPPEQAEAIRAAARAVGLRCLILSPDRLWAGQVEKRTFLLNAGAVGSDWLAVVDADHIVHADRQAARAELESYGPDIDVVAVPFYTPLDPSRPLEATVATGWHRNQAGQHLALLHLFRTLPGIRCEKFHWWYSALKDGRRTWLFANIGERWLPEHAMTARYLVEHRCLLRDERRMLAGRAFCNDRVKVVAQTGQEDDVPGLPEPVWDYVTVPY